MPGFTKNVVIFQGLFLIVFALYAAEKKKVRTIVVAKEAVAAEAPPEVIETRNLDELYRQLKKKPFFESPIDGVKIEKLKASIRISLQSDELYREGESSVEETWQPALDSIGDSLFVYLQNRFRVTFIGYANTESEPFRFSSGRAEWLYRYYESKYHLSAKSNAENLKRVFYISGGGAIQNGKRIEIEVREYE